jgi:hypothetical protein
LLKCSSSASSGFFGMATSVWDSHFYLKFASI